MKGLEAKVIHSLNWRVDNDALRLDSEYQLKAHLAAIDQVRTFGASQFKEDNPTIIHPHEIIREYVDEGGVWFLRAQNVRPLQIDPRNQVMISKEDADKLPRNAVKRGDVLVTRTGANRGQCAFFDRNEPAVASSHTFIIRPKRIDPEFLTLFLNTTHGIAQIDKGVYGAAQPEVAPYYLGNIWVPKIGTELLNKVKSCFVKSKQRAASSERAIEEAEALLLHTLGLANWTPPEPLAYSSRASEAITAGRLDAQYFMPSKQQVRATLAALPGNLLSEVVDSIREQWLPSNAPPDMFVRNYDVTDALAPLLDTEKEATTAAEIGSMKKVLRDGDVAISRLRAYLREIAVVRTGGDMPSVGSSEFIVLRPRTALVSPEALMVYLRSAPVQTILKWCQDGSQHPRFSESDLLSIPVPDVVASASPAITSIVQQGFTARHHARQLHDAARRAVELAIEEGEPSALEFLKEYEEAT